MRGFSIFAPVLGVMLVAAAIAVSVSIAQQETRRKASLYEISGKIYLNALPEALKWDAISSYIVALRNWFYDSYIYTPGALVASPPKRDIASSMLSFIGTDSDATWWKLGLLQYRYYVEDRATSLANIMDLNTDINKLWIHIKKDPSHIPKFTIELRTPGSNEKIETQLFSSDVGFAIFYPVKQIDKNVEILVSAANNKYFIAGFLHADDPEVEIGDVKLDLGLKKSTDPNPYRPAESAFEHWARKKDDARVYAELDPTYDALKEWLDKQGATLIQINSKEVEVDEGLPYYRLVCVKGDLARALSDNQSDTVCKEIRRGTGYDDFYEISDGNHVYYAKIKRADVDVFVRVSSSCAPAGAVSARVNVTLNFKGTESVPKNATLSEYSIDTSESKDKVRGAVYVYAYPVNTCDGGPDCERICETCGSDEICVKYDWPSAIKSAKQKCANRCAYTYSKGYLRESECLSICRTTPSLRDVEYKCEKTRDTGKGKVTWYFYKSDVRKKIGELLKNRCEDSANPGSKAEILCEFFGKEVERYPNDYRKPEISGGAAVLSITNMEISRFGDKFKIDSIEGKAEVTG